MPLETYILPVFFFGTADFDPGTGTTNLTSAGQTDVFVTKQDASGNLVWARQISGVDEEKATGLALDGTGNVYITGYFQGTTDFDPGSGTSAISATDFSAFICKLNNAGDFAWARKIGGSITGIQCFSYGIAVDNSSNVYTTGHFSGTVDFNPGAGTVNVASNTGSYDVFVSKLDGSGNYVWAKTVGGTQTETSNAITVSKNGFVYITGLFQDIVDFDPGSGTSNLSTTGEEVYILKLNSLGNFNWAKAITGNNEKKGLGIAADSLDNVYTTGYFKDTVDFDPSVATFKLGSTGNDDIFIHKLNADGSFAWAKAMGNATGFDKGTAITVDANTVYTTGQFINTVDFDPSAGVFNITASSSGFKMFISTLTLSGNFVNAVASQGTGTSASIPTAIKVDANQNIYVAGYYDGNIDFDPSTNNTTIPPLGGYDVYVLKFSQSVTSLQNTTLFVPTTLYPNPNKGTFQIQSEENLIGATLKIYNTLGQEVHHQLLSTRNPVVEFNAPQGVYQVILQTIHQQSINLKMLKQD